MIYTQFPQQSTVPPQVKLATLSRAALQVSHEMKLDMAQQMQPQHSFSAPNPAATQPTKAGGLRRSPRQERTVPASAIPQSAQELSTPKVPFPRDPFHDSKDWLWPTSRPSASKITLSAKHKIKTLAHLRLNISETSGGLQDKMSVDQLYSPLVC